MTAKDTRKTLLQLAGQRRATLVPGAFNALSARVIEELGFEALYITGAGVTNMSLGLPDQGFMGLAEICEHTQRIRDAVQLPLIVDADTGFGNAVNVYHTVRRLERAGADCVQLEDQTSPKRCGHLQGKSVIATREMVGKLRAAVDARRDDDTLIIARTDAVAVEGFDAALERAARYAEAGADLLFVEAVRSRDQMQQLNQVLGALCPLMANMVEGGMTPVTSAQELAEIGYRLVIFPGGTVRALTHALQGYLASLHTHGSTLPWRDRMLDFDALNAVIGTPGLLALGQRYA